MKKKRVLLMLLGGGMSQSDIAAVNKCSKRDVSACARAISEYGLTVAAVEAMKQASWLKGHMDAFEYFGGVPQMLVPDNCATTTDRSLWYVTLVNETYELFAEHYGTAVVPARVRKPRDKSLAEGTVDLLEQWIVAPASEMTFRTVGELNEFVLDRCAWLNARPFSDKDGSRDLDYEENEREHMLPLPPTRFSVASCQARRSSTPRAPTCASTWQT